MKVLNVFGIILAWILSIAMVIMLVAAPVALSALSVLDPETILEAVGQGMVKEEEPAASDARVGYSLEKLSAERDLLNEDITTDDVLGGVMDSVEDIIGGELDEEMLKGILSSDMAKELVEAYISDVTNAVTGGSGETKFTPELIAQVVEDNLDEVLDVVLEAGQELPEDQKEQIKGEIQKEVKENAQKIAQEIIKAVPAPEEILESNEAVKSLVALLARRNQIKWMIVGIIVAISLLIFGLRYPRFRGLRWLSANLFTAGGFNIVICLALGLGTSAVKGITAGVNAIDGTAVDGIIGTLLSQLTTGVIVRTVIIFVAAIVLLVGYILLKPFARKKKAAKKAEPVKAEAVEEAPVSEVAPAAVPSFIPAEAPVYTSVTVEPELMTEPAPVAENAEEKAVETPVEDTASGEDKI